MKDTYCYVDPSIAHLKSQQHVRSTRRRGHFKYTVSNKSSPNNKCLDLVVKILLTDNWLRLYDVSIGITNCGLDHGWPFPFVGLDLPRAGVCSTTATSTCSSIHAHGDDDDYSFFQDHRACHYSPHMGLSRPRVLFGSGAATTSFW